VDVRSSRAALQIVCRSQAQLDEGRQRGEIFFQVGCAMPCHDVLCYAMLAAQASLSVALVHPWCNQQLQCRTVTPLSTPTHFAVRRR
jgi:hypothetical protein